MDSWLRTNRNENFASLNPRITEADRQQPRQIATRNLLKQDFNHRHISPHTFRHSMAMGLLEAGIATEVIALFLGHELQKTTHLYEQKKFIPTR
ncbi:MAG: tyrosine-type recombinase/integrase [Limisphaerales bacterium]